VYTVNRTRCFNVFPPNTVLQNYNWGIAEKLTIKKWHPRTHTHTHTHTHTQQPHTHRHTHTHTYTHTHTHTHTHNTYKHRHTHACTHTHAHTCQGISAGSGKHYREVSTSSQDHYEFNQYGWGGCVRVCVCVRVVACVCLLF